MDAATHRVQAVQLFNRVWDLMEQSERSTAETFEMIHSAHASRYHWQHAGEPVNWARGEWQIARVYAVLRRPEPALVHARRCHELCVEHGLSPFDHAYAHEAMARSYLLLGSPEAPRELAAARELLPSVEDPEERRYLEEDLAALTNWA
jgi:hypothetical protein